MSELLVVGSGLRISGHWTEEGLSALVSSEKVFFLVNSTSTARWICSIHPDASSLAGFYEPGKDRLETYVEMVDCVLEALRGGSTVCLVLYGHPGVFCQVGHEAVRRARGEGFHAQMLPGISSAACLFADLGLDPAMFGCQEYEATDFLVRRRQFDPTSLLILWQAAALGVREYRSRDLWNRGGLRILSEVLEPVYGAEHCVTVYEAAVYPVARPRAEPVRLLDLPSAALNLASTLVVPPLPSRLPDAETLARLAALDSDEVG